MHQIRKTVYRNSLLALLGLTRVLSLADMKPPTKWVTLFDSVRASSGMVHTKLSSIDEEVGEEFIEKEEIFEKKIGKKKFYSEDEVEELKEKRNKIKV